MPEPQPAPYGSWRSPITTDLIVKGATDLGQIALDGDDIYWLESRPEEGGRNVIVRHTPDGKTADVTPPPFNVRSRVHEYGGAAYVVSEGTLFFSNFDDQCVYRIDPGSEPWPISPEIDLRYADGVIDSQRGRMICVREDHMVEGREAVNTITVLNLQGADTTTGGQVLVSGNDFYSSPCLSPNGSRLAWLTWNHPNMPWDGCELWVGEFAPDGSIGHQEKVAGGLEESIFQPEWSPDGMLYFVSDRTGWWNLYRLHGGGGEALCEMEAEFGIPQWQFGATTYGFESPERIVCAYRQGGDCHLAVLNTETKTLEPLQTPFTGIYGPKVKPGSVIFIGGSPTEEDAIVRQDRAGGRTEVIRRSSEVQVDEGYLSVSRAVEFPTEGGLTAHGFFYPPKSRDYIGPPGERPPLLVLSHGGPTSAVSSGLSLGTQFWTSRGFGVLAVNYGGSTGYGRAYMQRLNGQWGIVDVDDCANGARYLAERGEADPDRLAIRGGSAGGYTTLSALTFRDVFKAGASYFGISDLEAMTRDTHKFESRYLDGLVGPYPERRDLYLERSALHHLDRLSCPIIFFQGLEDKVVPPNQAEMMVEALRAKGLPVAYIPFEGEQHGFRKAETLKRTLEAELYFYSRVFGFDLPEYVEPVAIENM
jgi:dipeptidyl aminopeptidase/acylaminoacyl peptidase